MLSPTVFAIPVFASLIALEAYFTARRSQEEKYDGKDAWTNIALGFGSVGFGLILGFIQAFVYEFVYATFAPFQIPMSAWQAWLLLLFVDDFAYYWFHRISHEVRFFWNFHVVHHSSNQYNLSVAVRQSWFSGLAHWVFYIPVALVGFPLWAFATMHGFNLIYQFWIHTKVVKKLPAFAEYVLNTPSHHRVHHGVNDEYLDKNYAGIFIVWDRLFGTFVGENETPRYGIIKPIQSYNWLWINSHAWAEMFEEMRKKKTFAAKLRCVFGSPNMEFEEKP